MTSSAELLMMFFENQCGTCEWQSPRSGTEQLSPGRSEEESWVGSENNPESLQGPHKKQVPRLGARPSTPTSAKAALVGDPARPQKRRSKKPGGRSARDDKWVYGSFDSVASATSLRMTRLGVLAKC